MTGTAYPGDAVTGAPSYTATQGRTALAAAMGGATTARPLGGFSGVRPGTPANIATATSTTWTVTPFGGYIDLEALATNGGYYFSFQANETGSVTAAAVSARVDLLYVQISDSNTGDGSGLSPRSVLGYQAGVAGAGIPALSAPRAFVVAQINVPASGGGSPTVTWVAPYTAAAGAIQPALSSALYPATSYPGQYVDDAGLGLMRSNGTNFTQNNGTVLPSSVTGGTTNTATGEVAVSAASTVTLNGVFDANSAWYEVTVDLITSAAVSCGLTLGAAATNHDMQYNQVINNTGTGGTTLASSNWSFVVSGLAGGEHTATFRIFNPQKAQATTGQLIATSSPNPMSTTSGIRTATLLQRDTTQFTAITIAPASGTITGTIKVKRL